MSIWPLAATLPFETIVTVASPGFLRRYGVPMAVSILNRVLYTIVVIVTSLIAAAIVGSFDFVWSAITDLLYKYKV